jgi:ABC-2 type transport system ATP-binding protein
MIRALELDGISKAYGEHLALVGVSARAAAGEVLGVLGPNGAGKSTLLHCLVGLIQPSQGSFTVSEADGRDGVASVHALTSDRVGFAPDDLPMPDLLTGREYLDLVASLRGVRMSADSLHDYAAGVRLEGHLDALIGGYSHGMRRKIALLGALLHRPDVLVLDEPLRGLDPESGAVVTALITTYRAAGKVVIVSTHDMRMAEDLCDRVLILDHGEQVAHATPEELCTRTGTAALADAFLTLTHLDVRVDEAVGVLLRAGGLGEAP